ncbi:MAG: hypothetical protein ACPG8W_11860 [Candidatus Promineifilaceae bacterium]
MPTIIVRAHNVQDKKSLLRDLQKVLSLSYGELNKRINGHGIVATYILFMNDHKDVATKLRFLLDTIPKTVCLHLFQLEDKLDYDSIFELEN